MARPVLQSSANRSGCADVRRVGDLDEHIRAGVDAVLDGGELPGTSSTVLDLTGYEREGEFGIVREGAIPRGDRRGSRAAQMSSRSAGHRRPSAMLRCLR